MQMKIRLAREFKRFRREFHFSQTELAQQLGVSRDLISRVERKLRVPIPENRRKFYRFKEKHENERRQRNLWLKGRQVL